MSKVWKIKEKAPESFFSCYSSLGPLMAQLLYNRGLKEQNEIEEFLHPEYGKLHNPFLFRDMAKAADRIWQAVESQEKIFIYGDYDADAVTANAVLQQTFRYLGVGVESYIPDRFTEGYGLNLEAFKKIKNQGGKLVITVDCGTNSVEAADFCAREGIDLVITDHHEILGGIPKAKALINPKNPNDNYPCQDVTGVGVAFKLAQALLSDESRVNQWLGRQGQSRAHVRDWEKWLLDLVAIGTVADCHSLVGENRILVKYGLKVLAKSKWAGLRALCRGAALDFSQKEPDTYVLGFIIAPRLNAAGRLEHADIALHLLLEQDPIKAQEKAYALEVVNSKRQALTAQVLSEAREKILSIRDRKVLVLMAEDWPKGVVGLVAGKLAEEYCKPTIVLEKAGGQSTGSARSVGEFNIVEALKSASEYLIKFGGHKQAAGLTLRTELYENFYRKLLEYAEKNLSEADLQKQLVLEAEATSAHLTLETVRGIQALAPFGVGNPSPKFALRDCKVLSFREVGNGQKHLQLSLEKNNTAVPGIGFGLGYFAKSLKIGDTVDAAVELMEDGWNGRSIVKLKILDIKSRNNN